ncbi:MAG: DUF4197 domain-containing protein, partial [Flavobacteriales bacterium]|nr:DUF4197 domain-containing protein [Flavobacteriales bacterium]
MRLAVILTFSLILGSCSTTQQTTSSSQNGLTVKETTEGLVEALLVGADNSTQQASKKDGFFKNAAIKILFPPEAIKVREAAIGVGLTPLVDRFELSLNRAAEDASKEAKPILVNAIKQIKFKDVWEILFGGKTAATDYLRAKTEPQLLEKFRPIVKQSIGREEVTKHWQPLTNAYNSIPFVKKVNPDLEEYVTQRTVNGLFTLIAEEERKIRENPIARVSQILKKVFGRE